MTEKTNAFYESWVDGLKTALDSPEAAKSSHILNEFSLGGIAEYIQQQKPTNVVVMAGAGISTSAGIPDFRTPGSGLYSCLDAYDLPDPQAIFTIAYFEQNPEPFFTLAKNLYPKKLKPTVCHYFLRVLDEKGLLKRAYTQNIDSLEHVAGLKEEAIVAAHGSHHSSTCMKCRKVFSMQWMTDKLHEENVKVPRCDRCQGVVKPDIVFFGEKLPTRFFNHVIKDFPSCDLLLIMGTSLVVHPFASLIDQVNANVPRLLINLTKAAQLSESEKRSGMAGLEYDLDKNCRDVFFQGTCDEGCQQLADLLGWGEELKLLVKTEWAKIDAN